MYLVIAIVLFAIVFACSSGQQHKKNRQYEEYKSRQRKKTSREYFYAQFYFLELVQKLIPVFEEYKQCGPLFDRDTMEPNPKAVEIEKRWKSEVLTVNYREYRLEDIAVCKARERVIAEGYLPSNPYLHEYDPAYDPWKSQSATNIQYKQSGLPRHGRLSAHISEKVQIINGISAT